MTDRWTVSDGYLFREPLIDLRDMPDEAEVLVRELGRELTLGHELYGRVVRVVARALPQDDVLVELLDGVALVHLTWRGAPEPPPWPSFVRVTSPEHLEQLCAERY